MKERQKTDTPRNRIKWEDPKLVKLNKADQADGADSYINTFEHDRPERGSNTH